MSTPHTGGGQSPGQAGAGTAAPGVPSAAAGVVAAAVAVAVTGAGAVGNTFTAKMRDRQARGKDPYESSDASSDWASEGTRSYDDGGGNGKDEPFAVVERRRIAAQVLDSPELLMMAAQRDNESIPATRLRYTRMLCGFEDPATPPSTRVKTKSRPSAGSSRVSSGSVAARSPKPDAR